MPRLLVVWKPRSFVTETRGVVSSLALFLSEKEANAFGALEDLLLEIAQERDIEALLPLIVRRLSESSEDVALARIWLLEPGDVCGSCKNRPVCPSQEECLHLAASAIRSRGDSPVVDTLLAGDFRRIPVGAFKVGKVVARRDALVVADASSDPHIARPDWVREERIKSFAGQPLVCREQVLGVLGVFLRVELTQPGLDVLGLLARHAAAAIAGARALDEIARLQQKLQMENQYLREAGTLPPTASFESGRVVPEEEMRRRERENLRAALAASGGRIYGRGGAAHLLGLKPTTLASRLKKLGL